SLSSSERFLTGACANSRCTFGGIRAEAAAAAATRDARVSNRRRVSLEVEGYDGSIMRGPLIAHRSGFKLKTRNLSSGAAKRRSPRISYRVCEPQSTKCCFCDKVLLLPPFRNEALRLRRHKFSPAGKPWYPS